MLLLIIHLIVFFIKDYNINYTITNHNTSRHFYRALPTSFRFSSLGFYFLYIDGVNNKMIELIIVFFYKKKKNIKIKNTIVVLKEMLKLSTFY
jgi:hypothetical protein